MGRKKKIVMIAVPVDVSNWRGKRTMKDLKAFMDWKGFHMRTVAIRALIKDGGERARQQGDG
jgi:hypothetical protein